MDNLFVSSAFNVDTVMVWGIAILLIIIAVMLQWPAISSAYIEKKLLKVIKKLGRESMHDIMLPDGLGGFTYIEHLVLTESAIMVLYLKRYRGVIFAGEKIDEWTQVLNNNSYRFPNPLRQLEMDVMAIKNIVLKANAEGLVVFTQGSDFPKGKPANVILFPELEVRQKDFKAEEIPPELHTGWKRLQEQVEPCSKEFIGSMREDRAPQGHGLLASIFLMAALTWLGWSFFG